MLNFEDIKELAQGIKGRGGRAFLVGGFVRDQQMGLESKDFDLECFAISPAELLQELEIFSKFKNEKLNLVGESFAVFKVGLNLDVSIPRQERKTGGGHKGFEVTGNPNLSTFEACKRRDFTMNAMLLDPLTNEVIDHFGGKRDIELKRIAITDANSFVEDPLRVLRAVQFASRFGFELSEFTKNVIMNKTIFNQPMNIAELPRERVWMEFEKWLMQSPKPSVGLLLMKELGILEQLFPELDVLFDVPQDVRWHPEGNVGFHTAMALDVAKVNIGELSTPEQVTVMMAVLCHDLGKFETTARVLAHEDGSPSCGGNDQCGKQHFHAITAHGHAEAGVSLARNVMDRLALHSLDGFDVRGTVLALVEHHLAPFQFFTQPPRDSAFRRLATKVDLKLLHKVSVADAGSRNFNTLGRTFGTETTDWFLDKVNNLEIPAEGPQKILLGRHLLALGLKPSKTFGAIIDKAFEAQLEGQITNVEEAIAFAREELLSGKWGVYQL